MKFEVHLEFFYEKFEQYYTNRIQLVQKNRPVNFLNVSLILKCDLYRKSFSYNLLNGTILKSNFYTLK